MKKYTDQVRRAVIFSESADGVAALAHGVNVQTATCWRDRYAPTALRQRQRAAAVPTRLYAKIRREYQALLDAGESMGEAITRLTASHGYSAVGLTDLLRRKGEKFVQEIPVLELLEIYEQGATITEMARHFNVHYSTISSHLKKHHIEEIAFTEASKILRRGIMPEVHNAAPAASAPEPPPVFYPVEQTPAPRTPPRRWRPRKLRQSEQDELLEQGIGPEDIAALGMTLFERK